MNNSTTAIENIKIGQKVKMASMGHLIFTVTAENHDGTYTVETRLDQQNVLSYGNISKEMLRIVSV
ncbi:hypothetical protein [Acinetobacter bouvetii]|uniref:Uncharacterized protein n=1 Tax=Acinetobacter bouvetii TaxID=202951 RepID=A0A811GJC9_9GAMM|nr:hypothetical protein [Acinetobacter bouvetii]CAB1216140.1 hypothetical protein SFB21_1879 [Acinetobacter bouvetii]